MIHKSSNSESMSNNLKLFFHSRWILVIWMYTAVKDSGAAEVLIENSE